MSNIAGKAYAMNLITPVYTRLEYLIIFFVPGTICLLKSVSVFFDEPNWLLPAWFGFISLLLGIFLILFGLVRWLKIIVNSGPDKFVLWTFSLIFFILFGASSLKSTGDFPQLINIIVSILLFLYVVLCVVTGFSLIGIGFLFIKLGVVWLNKFIFWLAGLKLFQERAFNGLWTLSLIHYARWVIVRDVDFPRLSETQPKEKLKYGYMLFFSNFNGSWTQYVDSFSISIPSGLNLLWFNNVKWPNAVPETPFNKYVLSNQIWTNHYYSAYPKASSNDVKSAKKIKKGILELYKNINSISSADFEAKYKAFLIDIQSDISQMEETPVVSLATEAILKRYRIENNID